MKPLFFIILFTFISFVTFSQITQESSFDYSGTFVKLQNSGEKFYVMDVANSQCRIYNTNYTLWKTINFSIPANNYLYDIRYLSEGLFTNTNELCLAYVYYYYDDVNFYYTFNMQVIKENGTVLLSVPGCQYMNVYNMASGSSKFVTYSYDFSITPYTTTTKVFSLPGTLTSVPEYDNDQAVMNPAFPNPASSAVTIPYSLHDFDKGQAQLFDPNGRLVGTKEIMNSEGNVTFNVTGFPAGLYIYNINDNKGTVSTGK